MQFLILKNMKKNKFLVPQNCYKGYTANFMTLLGHSDTLTTQKYLHLANQVIISRSNISNIDSFMIK